MSIAIWLLRLTENIEQKQRLMVRILPAVYIFNPGLKERSDSLGKIGAEIGDDPTLDF